MDNERYWNEGRDQAIRHGRNDLSRDDNGDRRRDERDYRQNRMGSRDQEPRSFDQGLSGGFDDQDDAYGRAYRADERFAERSREPHVRGAYRQGYRWSGGADYGQGGGYGSDLAYGRGSGMSRRSGWGRGGYGPNSETVDTGFGAGERQRGYGGYGRGDFAGADNPWLMDQADGAQTHNGPHRGRGPRNYTRSDERIREDANDRLADDAHLDASEIEVQVKGGEVTLSGHVDDRWSKRRAEDCLDRVSGVKHVQNNLRVKGNLAADGAGPLAMKLTGGQSRMS